MKDGPALAWWYIFTAIKTFREKKESMYPSDEPRNPGEERSSHCRRNHRKVHQKHRETNEKENQDRNITLSRRNDFSKPDTVGYMWYEIKLMQKSNYFFMYKDLLIVLVKILHFAQIGGLTLLYSPTRNRSITDRSLIHSLTHWIIHSHVLSLYHSFLQRSGAACSRKPTLNKIKFQKEINMSQ